MTCRRAVILPTVLFVLLLLGLLTAMYAFRVNADLASTQANVYRMQARLAAEAGVDYVKMLLQDFRWDINRLYHNPDELNRVIVWSSATDPNEWGTTEEYTDDRSVFRFSIVADDPSDDEDFIRFGVTDESAKLNLNTATEDQLLVLFSSVLADQTEIDPQRVVDAIIDWRDTDADPHGEDADTEGEFYRNLERPYLVKNGPFDTVEELLLIKGITARVLYGEDQDRNGLITPNEDDGEFSFPPDNEDNVLNRGVYPYLTVRSVEDNVANNNRPRVYLFGPPDPLRAELERIFPDEPNVVDFIVAATRQPQGGGGGNNDDGEGDGDGGEGDDDQGGGEGDQGEGDQGEGDQGEGDDRGSGENDSGAGGGENDPGKEEGPPEKSTDGPRQQVRDQQGNPGGGGPSGGGGGGGEEGGQGGASGGGSGGGAGGGSGGAGGGGSGGGGGGSGGGISKTPPMPTPASLMRPKEIEGQLTPSPVGLEHLHLLLDRTTVWPAEKKQLPGLININTAPPTVLRTLLDAEGLPLLTEEQVRGIVATRDALSSDQKATPAWLLIEGVLELDVFETIAPMITARGQQFTIDSLGFADHVGMVVRLEVVVEMAGPIAQTIYYRDLTRLGGWFPIREEDKDRIRGG